MIARRVILRNFRSYADCTIEMPAGTVGVAGDNGAGKSTLMEAVAFALFGPDGRSTGPYIREGETDMLVELHVSHRDREFRIRRASRAGRTTLDFDVLDETSLSMHALTEGDQKDTQLVIERVLGVSKATFMNSVFLRQGAGGSFPKADPKHRRELLAEALDLGVYAAAHERVAIDRRQVESRCKQLDGRVALLAEQLVNTDQLQHELDQVTARIPDLQQQLTAAQTEAKEADELVRESERQAADRVAAAARVRELEQRTASIAEKTEMAAAAHAEITEQETLLGRLDVDAVALEETQHTLDEAEAQIRLHDQVEAENSRLVAHADEQLAVIARAEFAHRACVERIQALRVVTVDHHCDLCGQELTDQARATTTKQLEAEAEAHLEQRAAAALARETAFDELRPVPPAPDAATLTALRARVMELLQTPAKQQAARDRIIRAQAALASAPTPDQIDLAREELIAARQHLEALTPAAPDQIDEHRMRTLAAATRANELAATLNHHQQQHALLTDRLARARDTHDQHANHTRELDEARAGLQVLEVLEDAFGREGVPAWIVEHNAIPQIEQHANQVLDRLGGAVRRVELRTEREKKQGGTTATLDVVCHTDSGARDFQTFSGGEQTRADLALRLGLARLLAGRRSDVRMMMLDEPAGLDAAGMEALIEVLRDLTRSGEVESVLLASHVPALRDAFDTVIQVNRDGDTSRAVIA